MKKFITIFLALAMVFAMSTVAFAAENTNLTINGPDEREYEGYKLLKLSTGLKADHKAHDGDHTDGCYNYSYTVNEKYLAILQAEVNPNAASGVTADEILDYLSAKDSDENGTYKSMREVADRLYKAIIKAGIEADEKKLTGNNNSIEQGYWLFADITDLTDKNIAKSLVIVDTKGQDSLVITPKTGLPTIEKKVKDINDSKDNYIEDNAWHDSADHDIRDVVPFKLTATLPENVAYYDSYKIVFHDELSAGLTLDKKSIKVYMYVNKDAADADVALENGTDVTKQFVITTDALTDDCAFEVGCDNVLEIKDENQSKVVPQNKAIVVYYEATLNKNAVIGSAGNPNEVYLEFSNNPYDEESTKKTEKDKVIVFTYQLTINKKDESNKPLQDAGFELYKKNTEGQYVLIGIEQSGDDNATFQWEGLDDGDYKLVESTVPAGYNKMADIEFSITAEHNEKADDPKLITLEGGNLVDGDFALDGIIVQDIKNYTGTVLPETGAKGTIGLILGGSALAILAVVFMITRKKMSVYEA